MSAPRIGSLCTGAGMLDEGVRAVLGGEVVWHADTDPAASRVLAHRYPRVPNLGDLTQINWMESTNDEADIDVLAAGYPCQPDSSAGLRLSEDDHRWIFPDIARAIGVLRPRLVVLENVAGHFVRGFRTVLGSLAAIGFDADWTLVRASDVGAPHRRERLFVVAWPAENADGTTCGEWGVAAPGQATRGWARADAGRSGGARDSNDIAADAERGGRDGRASEPVGESLRRTAAAGNRGEATPDPSRRGGSDVKVGGATPRQHEWPVIGAGGGDRTGAGTEGVHELGGATAGVASSPAAADSYGDGREGVGRLQRIRHDTDRRRSTDIAWGAYEPAIRRWERTLGRLAPAPTERSTRGGQRLSPAFAEWMMGWPAGWVTDVPGISRNDALRICGNGVVPQQAAEALRRLLSVAERAA